MISLIQRAQDFADSVALFEGETSTSYAELLQRSAAIAAGLLTGQTDLREARVAFVLPSGADWVSVQWGIWRAGGICVPLSSSATELELEHVLVDCSVQTAIVAVGYGSRLIAICSSLGIAVLPIDTLRSVSVAGSLPVIEPHRRAMILYTSGTTSRPKGVVTTHANIDAQIRSLVSAWEWTSSDRIPLFLPMHHIHGIINVLSCALWSGATIDCFSSFDMPTILSHCANRKYTLFMAVPTVYVKLAETLAMASADDRDSWVAGFQHMRLMVSGSAALPASLHERWCELTGHRLLERYGMTEIGMAIANPLHGERRAGAVGLPLPDVEIWLRPAPDSHDCPESTKNDEPGEILVRGPAVFREYWNNTEAAGASFYDGWFCTGDMAICESGYYRILGRMSIDIIKSGGYKLSALEIEAALLEHPLILECAVVGIDDAVWGEAVAAAVVLHSNGQQDIDSLRQWCRDRLSTYKIPKYLKSISTLPRNAMGKVQKTKVKELFRTEH